MRNLFGQLFWFIFSICTAIIGHRIHGSLFWSITDFFFSLLAWGKWLICQEVNYSIIRDALGFVGK